jgi:hypothetical protein
MYPRRFGSSPNEENRGGSDFQPNLKDRIVLEIGLLPRKNACPLCSTFTEELLLLRKTCQRRSTMTKLPIAKILTVVCFTLALSIAAQAQATRTWVSGVGDDMNPCSRTAPCKTWAGAFSKTAINGEIDALDPGGYGTLNITKSITLDGTFGAGFGSTLSGATTGFTVNITNTVNDPLKTVRLRNLSITGHGLSGSVGTRIGINGVRVSSTTAANTVVYIENSLITDFTNRGISFEAINGGRLFVTDTTVRNCGASGIVVLPASGSTLIAAALDNVRILGNGSSGLVADNGSRVSISNSLISGNVNGLVAEATAGTAELNVHNCIVNHNTTGVLSGPGAVVIRLNDSSVQNNGTGVNVSSGTVVTYGNNRINGNPVSDVTGLLSSAGGPTSLLGTK